MKVPYEEDELCARIPRRKMKLVRWCWRKKLSGTNTSWKSLLCTYPFQEDSGLTLEQGRGLQISISIEIDPFYKLSRSQERKMIMKSKMIKEKKSNIPLIGGIQIFQRILKVVIGWRLDCFQVVSKVPQVIQDSKRSSTSRRQDEVYSQSSWKGMQFGRAHSVRITFKKVQN